jgi:hypothetical protein
MLPTSVEAIWKQMEAKRSVDDEAVCSKKKPKINIKTVVYEIYEKCSGNRDSPIQRTHNLKVAGSNPAPATNIKPR